MEDLNNLMDSEMEVLGGACASHCLIIVYPVHIEARTSHCLLIVYPVHIEALAPHCLLIVYPYTLRPGPLTACLY